MSGLALFQTAWAPRVLSILRIMTALLFMEHGLQKMFGFPAPMPGLESGLPPLLLAAALLELVGGTLMVLGLFTRPVAFILSGMMAVGYFLMHAPVNFYPVLNGGEAAVLYCFVFLNFFFAGGGSISLDALRGAKNTPAA